MTLRGLKKMSKSAAAILRSHYGYKDGTKDGELWLAKRHENYHGYVIRCGCNRRRRDLHYCIHTHPLKGTPMVGEMHGYYEPEWEERSALEELVKKIMWDERPASMTDADWAYALQLTGAEPVDPDEYLADMRAIDAEDRTEKRNRRDGPTRPNDCRPQSQGVHE